MMTYLPILTAVVSGLLVWLLGRFNTHKEDRKQEIKRLNRLLYNLLELKHWIDKEISADAFIAEYAEKMIAAIAAIDESRSEEQLSELKMILASGIKRVIVKQPQLQRLEQNINEIVKDYSEIDPFFAYDLTGKYQLTENLAFIKDSIGDIVPGAELIPNASLFMGQLIRPSLLADLQQDLVHHLPQIAAMINKKALTRVKKEYLSTVVPIDSAAIDTYCRDMLPNLINSASQFAEQEIVENTDLASQ